MSDFSLFLAIGVGIGLWRVATNAPRRMSIFWTNAALLALGFAALVGRTWYIVQHGVYYAAHTLEMFQIWNGGLAWEGAVCGAVLGWALVVLVWHIPAGMLADSLSLMLPPVAVACWLGCLQAGLAYGAAAPVDAWWAIAVPDDGGALAPRFPLQPVAAFSLLVACGLLEFSFPRKAAPGSFASLTCLVFFVHTSLFSLLRADLRPTWFNLPQETWVALAWSLISLVAFLFAFRSGEQRGLPVTPIHGKKSSTRI